MHSRRFLGQEARGAITGRITDPQGALVPGAKVAVTNTATNETRRAVSNDTGYYEVNYLEPSVYTVAVEADGFKKAVRPNITVNVGTRLEIDLTLTVGAVAETVEITAEAPLLETTTASGGRVLDQKNIVNLPFSDLNPFALSALAPGMQWTGQPEYRRPFDNGGTSSFNTMGGVGQNEYTIDGMTVTGTGRRVGFTPPADSITEFKLETSNFDASQGFTSGAAINVVSRAGSNQLHGSIFDQHWQQRWNATNHFTRENWNAQVAAGKISPDTPKQATGRSNNYGFTASGPAFLPKFSMARISCSGPITWNGIQPVQGGNNGFGQRHGTDDGDAPGRLFGVAERSGRRSPLHDIRSAQRPAGRQHGDPAAVPRKQGHSDPEPDVFGVRQVVPDAEQRARPGDPGADDQLSRRRRCRKTRSSIRSSTATITCSPTSIALNFRWQWNDRLADEYDWTYETARGLHSNGLTRIDKGGNIGWLWTMSANNILDTNFGSRVSKKAAATRRRTALGPKDVGLPDYVQQRAGANRALPRLDFDTITDVSDSYPIVGSIATTGEVRTQMTTIKGNHSFKYGWQERRRNGPALDRATLRASLRSATTGRGRRTLTIRHRTTATTGPRS